MYLCIRQKPEPSSLYSSNIDLVSIMQWHRLPDRSLFSWSSVAHHFSSLVASQKISEVRPLTNGETHCSEEVGLENKREKGHLLLPDWAATSPFGQAHVFLDQLPLEETQSCAPCIKTADWEAHLMPVNRICYITNTHTHTTPLLVFPFIPWDLRLPLTKRVWHEPLAQP